MKKHIFLLLALFFVLSAATPAMAFTAVSNADDPPYELDLYLVEYENNDLFGFVSLPLSERGYAKNEIIAAVCELTVPKGADDITSENYPELVFSGENVDLNVSDNDNKMVSSNISVGSSEEDTGDWDPDGLASHNELKFVNNVDDRKKKSSEGGRFQRGFADDDTYSFLFFAKVTGDDAVLTAALVPKTDFDEVEEFLDLGDYIVVALDLNGDLAFGIASDEASNGFDEKEDVPLFCIVTDEEFESTELLIVHGETLYTVVDGKNGLLFINTDNGTVETDEDIVEELMEIYEEDFIGAFGFDFALKGGVVDYDTFLDMLESLEVSVEIKPWTAYVTIPGSIVVDPPKTGGAAGNLGFLMIVLAAAATVAVRKVCA